MTNKETLDLCESLGIGVKTHSSSIEDAQADRVRRKAEREGLIRDVQPEEPAKAAKATKATKTAAHCSADTAGPPSAWTQTCSPVSGSSTHSPWAHSSPW